MTHPGPAPLPGPVNDQAGRPVPPVPVTDQTGQPVLPGRADQEGWRRLHKVTPLLRSWQVIVIVLAIGVQQAADNLSALARQVDVNIPMLGVLLIGGGIAVAVLAVIALWSWASWRATKYRVDEDALRLHTGVLFRQQRQVRLDRLQAIDVVQPLLGRIFGLAELKLEVAGGAGSDAKLAYLRLADAEQLRAALLAHAAGVTFEGEEAPQAPERQLAEVPVGRLFGSILRSPAAVILPVVVLVLVIVAIFGVWQALAGLIPGFLATGGAAWAMFNSSFGFRVAASPDGLRLRHGLLETRAQTVPPGRVQAVSLTQPLLWRGQDWWRLRMNVAGYAGSAEQSAASTVLMPVATRDEALLLLAQLLPDLGHPHPRELVEDGLTGLSEAGADRAGLGFICAPRTSRWLDPIAWRRHGVAVTSRALLIRSGRLRRRLVLVPHERTQSLGLTQGPLQRRLGLASFVLHSTPGPISPNVAHLAAPMAAELLSEQARRARLARAGGGPELWMRRPAAPAAVSLVKTDRRTRPTEGGGRESRG